jgi:hypothetical protein
MAKYRIKLKSLTCHQKRSQGKYHDSVTVTMGWRLKNSPKHDLVVSRLGLGHPRYGETFYPGKTYRFERNNSGWPGTDIDWEFDLDIPATGYRTLYFQVINDRFVKDPYAVTKAVLAISAAVGGAIAGYYLPKNEGVAAILAAALKGGASEAVKKLLGALFDDWPKCADLVFYKEITVNRQFLEDGIFPTLEESGEIGRVPSGCGQPRYTIEWSAERVESPRFNGSKRVVGTSYKPLKTPAGSKWLGEWIEHPSGGLPFVSVNIERSTVVEMVNGRRRAFDITIRESLPRGGSRKVLIDTVVKGIYESNRRGLPYNGKIKKAKATRSFEWSDDFLYEKTVGRIPKGAANGNGMKKSSYRLMHKAGGTGLELESNAVRVLGSFQSSDNLKEVLSDNIRPINLDNMVHTDVVETSVAVKLLQEQGASIHLPELGIELRLYTLNETLEDGTIRKSGPILRYFRATTIAASLADLQLMKGSVTR